jgi:hypothetical protein
VAAALADAQQAFQDGRDALAKGDFAAYGKAQDRLAADLKKAADAEAVKPATKPTIGPTISPTATSTPSPTPTPKATSPP